MHKKAIKVLPFVIAVFGMTMLGWVYLVTNFMGIPLDNTIGAPGNGQVPTYDSTLKKYKAAAAAGSLLGQFAGGATASVTTINASTNLSGSIVAGVMTITAAAGTTANTTPTGFPETSTVQKFLVPLYIYPTAAGWTNYYATSPKTGIVIANPNNGPDVSVNSDYTTGIAGMHTNGIQVIGYVHTRVTPGGAFRTLGAVTGDIDSWYSFYPTIDGIFFDQGDAAGAPTEITYFTALWNYVRGKGTRNLVVLNPGTNCAEAYAGISDIIVTSENTYATYSGSYVVDNWTRKYPATHFCHIVHTTAPSNLQAAVNLTKKNRAAYTYITDDPATYTVDPTYLTEAITSIGLVDGRFPMIYTGINGTTNVSPTSVHRINGTGGFVISHSQSGTTEDVTGSITYGTTANTALQGNDVSVTNARTPTAHATSHKNGGTDEVSTATAGANLIPKAGAGGTLAIGWIPTGTTGTTVPFGNDSRFSDSRTPLAHAASHQNGGSDEVATATPAANAIPKANGSNKLASGWLSEILNLADLLDVSGKTGTGSTVVMDTGPTINGATIPAASVLTVTQSTAIPAGYQVGVAATGTAASTIAVNWTAVTVSDGTSGNLLGVFTGTANPATAGPIINGRDQAGAFSATTWIYVYGISKADGTVPALLLSQSATAPTLPATYTKKSTPLTAFYTGAGSGINSTFYWSGGHCYYNQSISLVSSGTATSFTSMNANLVGAVPPQANTININGVSSGSVAGGSIAYSYDGTNSVSTMVILQVNAINSQIPPVIMPINGQTAYYKTSNASDPAFINCCGWGWSLN